MLELPDSIPPAVQEKLGLYLDSAAALGRRTAQMHLALGADTPDAAFRPEPLTPDDLRDLTLRLRDHAGSVAKQVRKLAQQPPLRRYVFLPRMGELVASMIHDILTALVEVDEAKARAVASRDDEVDRLYHASFDVVLDLMRADPDNVDRGTRILFAAHYLERIGDRVTNIAEDVLFLAGGVVEDLN